MELTERQERILRVLVDDYVYSGRPVGSATILDHSGLNVSSATVRHELVLLEDMGLVLQLHTSGGRIPTTNGYRYYVEQLLPTPSLSGDDQITIRHQFHQAPGDLDQWLKLAAAVLAHRAHAVALVTAPKSDGPKFRRVELVESSPHTALIVVILSDGTVVQESMSLETAVTQEELRANADELNQKLVGADTAARIASRAAALPERLQPFAAVVADLLSRSSQRRLEVYHEGLYEMLGRTDFAAATQPSLNEGERIRRVLDFLQSGLAMEDLLSIMAMENGVQVVIGGESRLQQLEDYAMVVGRYGAKDGSGILGLLGPTRMDYGQAISLVRYMTQLMTDLVFGR